MPSKTNQGSVCEISQHAEIQPTIKMPHWIIMFSLHNDTCIFVKAFLYISAETDSSDMACILRTLNSILLSCQTFHMKSISGCQQLHKTIRQKFCWQKTTWLNKDIFHFTSYKRGRVSTQREK